jgi:hypothetical protein
MNQRKQLAIIRGKVTLGRLEFPGEKGYMLQTPTLILLKDSPQCIPGRITVDNKGKV